MNAFTSQSSSVNKPGFFGLFNGGTNGLLQSTKGLLSCLDNVQANVLVADKEFNLIYANNNAVNTLDIIKDQVYEAFGVSLNDLVGGSIHRFHKDPKKIERILQNPSALPHTAEFSFGNVTLAATINSTKDANGMVTGYVVNWENVTKIQATKKAMAQVNSMMENAPVNVLFADKENFEINYANPSSIKTLKSIEQYLPISVDKLIGQSIDIFHKNPAHQQKLLSDPANLPHQAQIQVGPEILDLLVSPIYDDNKNYLGPMVTWDVVRACEKIPSPS